MWIMFNLSLFMLSHTHVVTIAMSLYVQILHCGSQTLFPFSHLPPLALTLFLPHLLH